MAIAAILGDSCTGHGCFPPRPNVTASPDVKAGSIGIQRVGDMYVSHCCPDNGCHPGSVSQGSGTVFINGRQAARLGDSINCGSSILGPGSPTVRIG